MRAPSTGSTCCSASASIRSAICPTPQLAARALANVDRLVVQSLELGSLEAYASAFLPAAPFLEKDGHVTTWEGRGQRLRPVRGAQGISLPDWEIFASMALACGGDLGFESLDELHEEMGRCWRLVSVVIEMATQSRTRRRGSRATSSSSPIRSWSTRAACPRVPTP